jgi:hypothetical protein
MIAGPSQVEAGSRASWTFLYTAGPLGIADGGWVFLQVAPFWDWSTPQVIEPRAPGYTAVSTAASGVTLAAETVDRQLLGIQIGGRALAPGEEITLVYGAGGAAALVDPFAEQGSPFWFAVDGDGDGIRGLLPAPLTVEVVAQEARQLILTLPSVVRPGAAAELRLGAVDGAGNRAAIPETTVQLVWRRLDEAAAAATSDLPHSLALTPGGPSRLAFTAPEPGAYVVEGSTAGGLVGASNPLLVSTTADEIVWGDLHGHSNLSDGTGTPEQYFLYARDVAGLDFAALTDHDHWGLRALAQNPEMWEEIRQEVARFHEPGGFVTLLGYEWTNWLHGHRHVLYFADDGPVLSSVDPRYETPAQLWQALAGYEALTFAHHSAGEPVATNWNYPPDPELEPVTEIVSIHGSSEAADGALPVRGAIEGNFVRDVLARGYRLGFIGSGDGHDGHPGLAALANPSGGLAALLTKDLSRAGIRQALRERRAYATNGPRIVLGATLDGAAMGSVVPPSPAAHLVVDVVGTAPLERLDIIRVRQAVDSVALADDSRAHVERALGAVHSGDVLYVRVIQRDGGAAWSSPFFVDESPSATGPQQETR